MGQEETVELLRLLQVRQVAATDSDQASVGKSPRRHCADLGQVGLIVGSAEDEGGHLDLLESLVYGRLGK